MNFASLPTHVQVLVFETNEGCNIALNRIARLHGFSMCRRFKTLGMTTAYRLTNRLIYFRIKKLNPGLTALSMEHRRKFCAVKIIRDVSLKFLGEPAATEILEDASQRAKKIIRDIPRLIAEMERIDYLVDVSKKPKPKKAPLKYGRKFLQLNLS